MKCVHVPFSSSSYKPFNSSSLCFPLTVSNALAFLMKHVIFCPKGPITSLHSSFTGQSHLFFQCICYALCSNTCVETSFFTFKRVGFGSLLFDCMEILSSEVAQHTGYLKINMDCGKIYQLIKES